MRSCYLAVACDADPDVLPGCRTLPSGSDPERLWSGFADGIVALRRALSAGAFTKRHGELPITWLLRSDRQILEVFGDPGFAYRRFEHLWDRERAFGSDLGWHPHLYRWSPERSCWTAYLSQDDDLDILAECLQGLRRHTEVTVVRTGWDYHSNALMAFLDEHGLMVDGSAVPGNLEAAWAQPWNGAYDWEGAPRFPYHPSRGDYRRPAREDEEPLQILEVPALVLRLRPVIHLGRYLRRCWRSHAASLDTPSWETARWQGQLITSPPGGFRRAVEQTLEETPDGAPGILATYFHPIVPSNVRGLRRFIRNLETVAQVAGEKGLRLVPTTLAQFAREHSQWNGASGPGGSTGVPDAGWSRMHPWVPREEETVR